MTFSKEIITVLDYLAQKFGVAIDWTSENIMPYLQDLCGRFINYEVYTSILYMIISIVIALILGSVCKCLHKKMKNSKIDYRYDVDGWMVGFIFSTVVFVISVVVCLCVIGIGVEHIIECKTLPEKVVIEYIQGLIESK